MPISPFYIEFLEVLSTSALLNHAKPLSALILSGVCSPFSANYCSNPFGFFEQLQQPQPKEVQTATTTTVASSSPPNEINVKNSIAIAASMASAVASENPIKMEESLKPTTTSQLSGKKTCLKKIGMVQKKKNSRENAT